MKIFGRMIVRVVKSRKNDNDFYNNIDYEL